MRLRLAFEAEQALAEYAEALAGFAGREVRCVFRCAGSQRAIEGRVPRRKEWRTPREPCLLLPPGRTDGVHVLAEMEVVLVRGEGEWGLARRRWYEEAYLDQWPLGRGELVVEITSDRAPAMGYTSSSC